MAALFDSVQTPNARETARACGDVLVHVLRS
jgi:hypothetical protein